MKKLILLGVIVILSSCNKEKIIFTMYTNYDILYIIKSNKLIKPYEVASDGMGTLYENLSLQEALDSMENISALHVKLKNNEHIKTY